MYCPNCGTQNLENINFCSSCGLDLSTVARMMEKHLPLRLLEKIDDKLLNPKKTVLYESCLNLSLSIVSLVVAILLSNWGYPRDALYFYIGSFFAFLGAIWFFLIYVRARSKTKMVLTTSDYIELNRASDGELCNENETKTPIPNILTSFKTPVPSVTEFTTNPLHTENYKTKKLPEGK
ncbi:MAG: zinc ribbon domain-containing protein [Pyrinomonadaceae bacterium]|nr:zinc ribbon domain-containing protein [Pyrinomonadaceae bacterium]